MGKGEINGRAGIHHNDTDGETWELHVRVLRHGPGGVLA